MLAINNLALWLIFFILLSGFFSGSETCMMALNRYRLKHKARKEHRGAKLAYKLLQKPDQLLSIILIGNTFANVIASALATMIAVQLFGDAAILPASIILTLLLLIFAEITPKTIAASHAEKLSLFVAYPLNLLLKILYPVVWAVNILVAGILKTCGIRAKKLESDALSHDELRSLLRDQTDKIAKQDQNMLLGILDLNRITVNDVMVPRDKIVGINLDLDWLEILKQLKANKHPHLLAYNGTIENTIGILHLHRIVKLLINNGLTKKTLIDNLDESYFIPELTPLSKQLVSFQKAQVSIALIVDEYGAILGLVSMEDILEEIVGEFSSELNRQQLEIYRDKNGDLIIDGNYQIRDLNRSMQLNLPANTEANTLSGLVIEYFEAVPPIGMWLKIAGYPIEVLEVEGNVITRLKIKSKVNNDAA